MRKEFDLLVDDHILKWAKKELWDDTKAPHKITERSLLGMLIFGLLNDRRKRMSNTSANAEFILKIELSDTLAKRSPDPLKLSRVNNILEKLFRTHLQKWVDAQNAYGRSRYEALVDFFKRYEIECSQQMIERYQKHIQRANSRTYKDYLKNKYEILQ